MSRLRRAALAGCIVTAAMVGLRSTAHAEEGDYNSEVTAESVDNLVRVTVQKMGGEHVVQSVSEGAGGTRSGCSWTLLFVPKLEDAPYGISPGDKPHPDARFALLLCNGNVVRPIWVAPADIVDLDEAARSAAQRYIADVLTPVVSIGVNPSAKGLAGLRSWFWIEGFAGSVTAPPISAFGLTIDVRMSSGSVTWDFGDGTVERGDLGRAYPQESTVQHAYRDAGRYAVSATIALVPEYRVNGGPWLTLPALATAASTTHEVEQRQPVITET